MGIKEDKEAATPLHGDILEEVIFRVPSLHLVPATCVSKSWRSAVSSTIRLSPRHRIPWLILHLQTRHSNSKPLTTFAFDPTSRAWIQIPRGHHQPLGMDFDLNLLAFSHPGLLHALTFSKLFFSTDAFATNWRHTSAPSLWRSDAIVALVGPHLVVAGGTCDSEDDPCAVEVMRSGGGGWKLCESMPEEFRDRADATWLSVAVSDRAMYVADRNTGWYSCFDPLAGKWGKAYQLRPDPALYVSAIGVSGDRLILVGAVGEAMHVGAVVMWEVNPVTMQYAEIGRMPVGMAAKLAGRDGLWSIGFSNVGDWGYIYNPSEAKEVFLCEFGSQNCRWEMIGSPKMVDDQYPMLTLSFGCSALMLTLSFGCSAVGLADLGKLGALNSSLMSSPQGSS